ncbi:lysosomal proton-coupled steroid conjugate and bile acid symporter SLC46A3-like isoform X2 [Drosophila nasuta]|uniref:lysosomal proton-coupled steroid conjugate and bile acid symporter SLC46A3-like isoform X2 n=1 Tax=Drosophila nasuta TaxID=42062 RepID=UPI00295F2A27|nr:lysosomal proton-coupled steroid conjugate and bile acid symporter SLC46A3-like isoform X2 [Drosophila nasuta]
MHILFQILSVIFLSDLPSELSIYLCAVLRALFGGHACFMMSVFCFMTSTTSKEDRTLRFGIFIISVLLTKFVSNPSDTELYYIFKVDYSITTGVILQLVTLLYIAMIIKEPKSHGNSNQHKERKKTNNMDVFVVENNGRTLSTEVESSKVEPPLELARRHLLREFFDPMLLMELIKFPFQRRSDNRRSILLLLILCYLLTVGPSEMESEYLKIHKENNQSWNFEGEETPNTVRYTSSIIGTILGLVVFKIILKFSDLMIGIWSSVFTVVSFFIYAFATDATKLYVVKVLDLFRYLSIVSIKSTASIITHDEGKLFAIFSILQLVEDHTFPYIYNAVYAATSKSFPGGVFVLSNFFYVPTVLIFTVCYFLLHRRGTNLATKIENP